jgi:putative DNA primase/helicase
MSDSTGVHHPNFDEPIFSRTESESVASGQGKTRSEVTELDGPDGLHLTSMGNAERFLRDHKSDVVWVQGPTRNSAGTFHCWDGQRWQADDAQAMLLAKETVSNLEQLVAIAAEDNAKSDVVKALVNFWRSCERDNKVEEILSLARWDLVIKQRQFDTDPDLLGVRNGVVDLRTGTLRDAMREDYITKQTNVLFDETATCPQWEKFLLETAQGDYELISYLQQCAGISLTGHTKEHLFFIVIGPGGTGKSTFFETIKYVWGDYACGIDPNSLAASMKAEGGRARPDIARLPGVRLAFANETRKGQQLDAGLIKALTGGDTVQARHLYQAEFDFTPTHKLWLRTNEEPQFDGADTGMQRRVKKIPFLNVIKNSKAQDTSLAEKLRAEAPGILNWAIRGWLAYQKHGLQEPAIVQRETSEYLKSLDTTTQFIEEECEVGAAFKQPAGELYQRYRAWIDGRGQKALGSPRFRTDLQAKGYRWNSTKHGNLWYGLRLRDRVEDRGR